jgi:hypothetical protein
MLDVNSFVYDPDEPQIPHRQIDKPSDHIIQEFKKSKLALHKSKLSTQQKRNKIEKRSHTESMFLGSINSPKMLSVIPQQQKRMQ